MQKNNVIMQQEVIGIDLLYVLLVNQGKPVRMAVFSCFSLAHFFPTKFFQFIRNKIILKFNLSLFCTQSSH